jgi:hypothetical protein
MNILQLHPYLTARLVQLNLNSLVLNGGREYIDTRLSRFPAESDIDFLGLSDSDAATLQTQPCDGRKARAFVPNHAGRISDKINQYVFQTPVTRESIDPFFAMDVSATGESITQFMSRASTVLTGHGWGWVCVDRTTGSPGETIQSRKQRGDRLFWKILHPQSVINWQFDSSGRLLWAVVKEAVSIQETPFSDRTNEDRVFVWEPGFISTYDEKGNALEEKKPTGYPEIPLACFGQPSPLPWWFDSVEACMKTILDKQSALDTAIYKSVFPLLVLPVSVQENARLDGVAETDVQKTVRLKIGMCNPVTEKPDEKSITRYVTGQTTDLKFIREEIMASMNELYETVGLALKTESKAAQSGEAKAWITLTLRPYLHSGPKPSKASKGD